MEIVDMREVLDGPLPPPGWEADTEHVARFTATCSEELALAAAAGTR